MSFLVWVYTSQDFAQSQQNVARLHDRVTVTFKNSAFRYPLPWNLGTIGTICLPWTTRYPLPNLIQ